MDLKPVTSSLILQVGYDSNSEVLVVQFKNGSYYQYDNVSEQMYNNMIDSSSIGKYFSAYIKNTRPYKQIFINEEM